MSIDLGEGEPAFPHARDEYFGGAQSTSKWDGMTKRELIAMHIMASLTIDGKIDGEGFPQKHADNAVMLADELIAALKRRGS